MINWLIWHLDCKYVTARKAGDYLLAGKSIWRGWDNWWSQDIDFGSFDTLRGQCRVPCVSSFRGTSFFSARFVRVVYLMVVIRYCIPDLLLAVSWRLHARATTPREPGQPCIRVYQIMSVLSVCVCVMCNNRRFYWLQELYEADFHKPGIYGSGRVWANAWDVFRRTPSRGGRGHRAAADFVVGFGCGGISCFPGFCIYKFVHTTSGCERPRAVSVDSVNGLRQLANLPTENSRSPIPTRCTIYCAPPWESWRQLISKVAHSPSRTDPRAFPLQEFFKLWEHQSPLLARQSTSADTRERDV